MTLSSMEALPSVCGRLEEPNELWFETASSPAAPLSARGNIWNGM